MNYQNPSGVEIQGKDIKWCGRNTGGKKCCLCRKYVKFNVWSNEWFCFYLISYDEYNCSFWHTFVHHKYFCYKNGINVGPHFANTKPVKYNITGLHPHSISSLLKRGCKPNKKCKCVSLIQRGFWYCPECWKTINSMAKIKGCSKHDLMIMERKELKQESLIFRLSGLI